MGLVATILDSADIEYLHHCRGLYWAVLVYKLSLGCIRVVQIRKVNLDLRGSEGIN